MAQFLPNEILQEIFNNDSQNIKFLHSCLLVNKTWNFNVIPILWNQPFHLLLHCSKKYSHHIISTYLNKHATHNYHSFLRHLSFFSFIASVQEWCTINLNENAPFDLKIVKKIFLFVAKFTPMLESLEFTFEIESLIKLMNAKLFNSMIVFIIIDSKVRKWVSDVKEIFLQGDINGPYCYDFSMILHSCRNIKTLKIRIFDDTSRHYFSTVNKICQLIKSQINLESFTFYESEFIFAIGDALIQQKSSLCNIEFSKTKIFETDSFNWILHCSNLESVIFNNTSKLACLFRVNQSKLKKLKCLVIKEHYYIPSNFVISLIQSSNINLQKIEIEWPNDHQCGHSLILENISYHCANLSALGATIGTEEFPALLLLLKNCKKLKILEIYGNGEELDVDGILPELGLHNLAELIIRANWRFKHDSLLTFFENSKHTQLYKVVIKFCDFINDDHLEVIAKYSMDSLKFITLKDKMFLNTDDGIRNASIWLKHYSNDMLLKEINI